MKTSISANKFSFNSGVLILPSNGGHLKNVIRYDEVNHGKIDNINEEKSYTRYSDAYRQEALALADRIGVAAAARELGIHASQLYQWRSKAQLQQDTSERERSLAEERPLEAPTSRGK
ncbi:hypothetical protein HSBAA_PA_2180 (plasmid) [Vreelandella sulfidaeris]|uniref:Transposase n=1 Tax=Vreelandella sulfidaeris TaxID=115553 RepID=A0A455UHJ3_9GAMM|nr:hypothetical protein HSBAA_PA_2180 [Halomonas sulfidaeris]